MVIVIGGESGLSQSNIVGMNNKDELVAVFIG